MFHYLYNLNIILFLFNLIIKMILIQLTIMKIIHFKIYFIINDYI